MATSEKTVIIAYTDAPSEILSFNTPNLNKIPLDLKRNPSVIKAQDKIKNE